MSDENALLKLDNFEDEEFFDLEELEKKLESDIVMQFSELKFFQEEKEKIDNPDELGKVVLNEVWNQFGNQIGLDITNETLIQKYDREHQESYGEVTSKVLKDERYTKANSAMLEKQKAGSLIDEYTGNDLCPGIQANLDHVRSQKENNDDPRRKQANLSTADVANLPENLRPTNQNLNKSMQDKPKEKYLENRDANEKKLIEKNERDKRKIDESNMSDAEKAQAKEKADLYLQNKLDASDELIKNADKVARKAINKEIRKNAVKNIGKKAGVDALKSMAVSALFSMLKEIMNGVVRFFKSKSKSFKKFLSEMKESLKSFFSKILNILTTGGSSLMSTIVTEIFGPIVSVFKKLASFIRQGITSITEAIFYLKNKDNQNKPFSVKVAQIGKIVTAGIVAGGAILLGEVFEKILLAVPGMQIVLPLMGTLANVIGLFLASLVSGLFGAIVINLIDKMIATRQKNEAVEKIINKGNEVLKNQSILKTVAEVNLDNKKDRVANSMAERHKNASDITKEALDHVMTAKKIDNSGKLNNLLDDLDSMLD